MTGTTPSETSVREVTDHDFEAEVEKSPEPIVVVFVSAVCPHCTTLLPLVDDVARDFRGRVRFVTMDVVENPWTAERYGVRGTPTLTFFCHGRPVQEIVGALPPAAIRRQVEEFVVHGEECVQKSTEIDYDISGYA